LEQTYGKPPALNRCPTACLPKPASFTPAELDAAAAKSGINWCENCVQVGGYMPLASVLQLEKAANVTICVGHCGNGSLRQASSITICCGAGPAALYSC
jgi:hypothetical protein